jgi:FkbM family methyltransferase
MRDQENTDAVTLQARIPVELRCPAAMVGSLAEVLEGEYESGCVGEGLRVLDIGANAGAFSIWAAHRWPGSTIDAYEANPSTFPLLRANTRSYPMVRCHNSAIYPSTEGDVAFTSRYAGDGEAGVLEALSDTFGRGAGDRRTIFRVPALHPRELPPADIIKLDVEGAETAIIQHADLSSTALLLIEYQHSRNLDVIKTLLAAEFEPILETHYPWSALLSMNPEYQQSLAGDHYGLLFLLRRGQVRLRRLRPATGVESPL